MPLKHYTNCHISVRMVKLKILTMVALPRDIWAVCQNVATNLLDFEIVLLLVYLLLACKLCLSVLKIDTKSFSLVSALSVLISSTC